MNIDECECDVKDDEEEEGKRWRNGKTKIKC